LSNYSTIYEILIKLGIRQQQAHRVAKELVEKTKTRPVLTDEDLKKEIDRLSKAIGDLSEPKNKEVINYLHAIIQGVLATGVFELLMLIKSWVGTFFMSASSREMEKLMEYRAMVNHHVNKQFYTETSDLIVKHLMELDAAQNEIIHSAINEVVKEPSQELIKIVHESLDNLVNIIEYRYAEEFGFVNKT
jgi:hypothetical protein